MKSKLLVPGLFLAVLLLQSSTGNHPLDPFELSASYQSGDGAPPLEPTIFIDDFEDGNLTTMPNSWLPSLAWSSMGDGGGLNGDGSATTISLSVIGDIQDPLAAIPPSNKAMKLDYSIGQGNDYPFCLAYVSLPAGKRNITGFKGIQIDYSMSSACVRFEVTLESPLTAADGFDHFRYVINNPAFTNWAASPQTIYTNDFTRGGWGVQPIARQSMLSNVISIQIKVASANNAERQGEIGWVKLDNIQFITN